MNNKLKFKTKDVEKFLIESNAIEQEGSFIAYEDAEKAWDYLKTKRFLTPEIILGVHHQLMRRLNPKIAGFWRDCNVWIGGHKKTFISVQLIEEDIINAIGSMEINAKLPIDDLNEFTKQSHIRFEEIHPFTDGNGRTGRLIYLWHRMKLGLPINIIHADWETKGKDGEQFRYYSWFRS